MRHAVLGSVLVHLAILIVLFIVRAPAPTIIPGPEVVQVALLDSPSAVPAMAAPPPPKPQPMPEVRSSLCLRKNRPYVEPRITEMARWTASPTPGDVEPTSRATVPR